MTMKTLVAKQYRNIINKAALRFEGFDAPNEGWIRTVRKSLNMSGSQLARRLNVTRARLSKAEAAEIDGAITIHSMQNIANAMGCKFIYAIVPEDQKVETIIMNQARNKAIQIVAKTDMHMRLEAQGLSNEQLEFEINRITKQLIRDMPRDLWND